MKNKQSINLQIACSNRSATKWRFLLTILQHTLDHFKRAKFAL